MNVIIKINEREFNEILININWNEILSLDENETNICMNNLHLYINYLLDEFAPHKKVSKKTVQIEI